MFGSAYYHGVTRKVIIAFGNLFSNITLDRVNKTGIIEQKIKVPVSYGNREKWYSRLQEEPNLEKRVAVTLPRIGFEFLGMQYDAARKINRLTQLRQCGTTPAGDIAKAYAPVPYNLNFNVYVVTKTQDDALRIIEQIVPYFTPQYAVTIELFPALKINQNIPFNLNDVSYTDSFDGPMETRREIIYTLNFTAKAEYLGPIVMDANQILTTRVRMDPTGEIGREVSSDANLNQDGSYTIVDDYFDIPAPISWPVGP
jgi:hypothetical protein